MAKKKLTADIISRYYVNDTQPLISFVEQGGVNTKDSKGRSLIFHSIINNDIKLAQFLLDRDADINLHDNIGWTPLHYAVQDNNLELTYLLITNGAMIDAVDLHGNSILGRAVYAYRGDGRIIQMLLEKGANENSPNNYGISPASLANAIANYDVSKFFEK